MEKLNIHKSDTIVIGQDKTKSILYGTKHKLRNANALNIVYNGTEIKQYAIIQYPGCILDQSLSCESMALNVIDKVNSRLKFLQRQSHSLTPPLRRLLCNTLIQPLFNCAFTAWFLSFSKILKLRLQASQNKCIRFYLQLDKRSKLALKSFYS